MPPRIKGLATPEARRHGDSLHGSASRDCLTDSNCRHKKNRGHVQRTVIIMESRRLQLAWNYRDSHINIAAETAVSCTAKRRQVRIELVQEFASQMH